MLGLLVVLFLALVTGFIDAARQPADAFQGAQTSEGLTLIGILLSGGVGGLYWWFVVRRRVIEAKLQEPLPAYKLSGRARQRALERERGADLSSADDSAW